jgi:hypothetical protein
MRGFISAEIDIMSDPGAPESQPLPEQISTPASANLPHSDIERLMEQLMFQGGREESSEDGGIAGSGFAGLMMQMRAGGATQISEIDDDVDKKDARKHSEDGAEKSEYSFDFSAVEEKDDFMERLGVALSVFFQNDKGHNLVDAVQQNSKVLNNIYKKLDVLVEHLTKPPST